MSARHVAVGAFVRGLVKPIAFNALLAGALRALLADGAEVARRRLLVAALVE